MNDEELSLKAGAPQAHGGKWSAALVLGLGGLLLVGGFTSAARAQTAQVRAGRKAVEDVKRMRQAAEEAPIPTAESVERGEEPRASVSFQVAPKSQVDRQGQPAVSAVSPDAPASSGPTPARVTVSEQYALPATQLAEDEERGEEGARPQPLAEVPELHTVVAGDTLWSLCKTYYGDPWQWPQLWALNPSITNPHWIFPGDVVRLRAPDLGGAPADGADAGTVAATSALPRIKSMRAELAGAEGPFFLREVGFLDTGELRAAGRITGSREEKIMLATGDQAYVAFPRKNPLRAGARYSVFNVDRDSPVIDPNTKKVVGYLVRIYGDILIEQVVDEDGQKDTLTGRGTLVDMIDVVERGYYVSQAVKPFKRVAVRPSSVNLQANVIASFSPANLLSPANFVILSRGAADGIEVGNRTYVIRRGDGYARLLEGWETFDPSFPKEVVAELLVVDVREKTAVAWISRATKEIRVGETTEMRKGY